MRLVLLPICFAIIGSLTASQTQAASIPCVESSLDRCVVGLGDGAPSLRHGDAPSALARVTGTGLSAGLPLGSRAPLFSLTLVFGRDATGGFELARAQSSSDLPAARGHHVGAWAASRQATGPHSTMIKARTDVAASGAPPIDAVTAAADIQTLLQDAARRTAAGLAQRAVAFSFDDTAFTLPLDLGRAADEMMALDMVQGIDRERLPHPGWLLLTSVIGLAMLRRRIRA